MPTKHCTAARGSVSKRGKQSLRSEEDTKGKGRPPSADLRYEDEDIISPSTLIFAATKGYLGIYTLYIIPDVPKKLALR